MGGVLVVYEVDTFRCSLYRHVCVLVDCPGDIAASNGDQWFEGVAG